MLGAGRAEQLTRSLLWIGTSTAHAVVEQTAPAVRGAVGTVDDGVSSVLRWVAAAALDRVDVTALVRDNVDLDALVATVDVDAIADRLDLLGLAAFIIDGIDLPAIIRESTGGITSDALRSARLRSYGADETVARAIDRVLLRHRARDTTSGNGWHPEVTPG
jgi:hypothetical protein